MLPRKNRLSRKETHLLFRRGRRAEHALAWARYLAGEGNPKFAFAVSSGMRLATRRNRLKRVFREVTRGLLPRLSNGWLVAVIKVTAQGSSPERVQECMASLCQRAGMMVGQYK